MKIHEYQAKQIFARYGVPIPKGVPCVHRGRGRGGRQEARDRDRQPGRRRQGADPRRRPRQGRAASRSPREAPTEARAHRREDARHAARHAPDRPRRAEGAAPLRRAGARHRARALPRRGRRPRPPPHRRSWPRPRAAWRSRRSPHKTPEKIVTVHVDPVRGPRPVPGARARLRARPRHGKETMAKFVQARSRALRAAS